jgi:hypothetical protein
MFWISNLIVHVKYNYILATNWFFIIYIMYSRPLSHKYEQRFLIPHFQNP